MNTFVSLIFPYAISDIYLQDERYELPLYDQFHRYWAVNTRFRLGAIRDSRLNEPAKARTCKYCFNISCKIYELCPFVDAYLFLLIYFPQPKLNRSQWAALRLLIELRDHLICFRIAN